MAALLNVSSLQVSYFANTRAVQAVRNISFEVAHSEIFAIVGESGCGKSTLALSLFRLLPSAGRIISGQIELDGENLLTLHERDMIKIRGRKMGLILQESLSALNPVMKVGKQIAEVREHHFSESRKVAKNRALALMERVRLPQVEKLYQTYPHQLSGGQRQRIAIAIALAGEPGLLVADEPTTALDVSIQSQMIELLRELRRDMQLALLLISHDLAVVSQLAQRVAVMHEGSFVEQGATEQVFLHPSHAYTKKLLRAVPKMI